MATTLQAHHLFSFSSSPSSSSRSSSRSRFHASLRTSTNQKTPPRLPLKNNLSTIINFKELSLRENDDHTSTRHLDATDADADFLISKLHAIANSAADRAEMHDIIGEQRNNWAHLLTNSTNSLTLAASVMAGLATVPSAETFKVSSALLFVAAAGVMAITNKIQPSQLVEEQRNATRLFRQLDQSIRTNLELRSPTELDVEEAMASVLALDAAYPLPLLPGMLEKFPETLEPTVWWPKRNRRRRGSKGNNNNGWSEELEREMKGILRLIKEKDIQQYVRVGKVVLDMNRAMSVVGPLLAGVAAVGACAIGADPVVGHWGTVAAVVGGSAAAVVNTFQHGGQAGMAFELFRNCAGFYRKIEEEIESELGEREIERRENGEMFEMKIALLLGRSISEMRGLASYADDVDDEGQTDQFAGKLF